MAMQMQTGCACCVAVPVPSECRSMLTNDIATYYRVAISGCTGLDSVDLCCASTSGVFIFGPIPSGSGGSDATDDYACCFDLPIEVCDDGFGGYRLDTIRLCFRRYGGGSTYETAVTFHTDSNPIGFYKQTGVPQAPLTFNNEPLSIKINGSYCGLHGCTCTITAIPPP